MTKLVNLTPHAINLILEGTQIVIPPSGTVARCATTREMIDTIKVDGAQVPVNKTTFGEVSGLPEPETNTVYIVSSLVAQAVPDRPDVLVVDDAVRDEAGRIIGARALAHI